MPEIFPMIIPYKCRRIPTRPTARNFMGQQVVATRKIYEGYHTITYTYEILSSRQYRIISNHHRSMDGGKTSFYVVDWGDPRPISAISGRRFTVNNIQGFSINSGDGGNQVLVWQNKGDYGDDSSVAGLVITDRSKVWTVNEWQDFQIMDSVGSEFNASVNSTNTLTVITGTPVSGAYDIYRYAQCQVASINTDLRRLTMAADPSLSFVGLFDKFVLPIYECFYLQDALNLEPSDDGFNYEPNDNYGPYYDGSIEFIQRGMGT